MASFRLTGKWQKMQQTLDPNRFRNVLEKDISQATRNSAQQAVAEIRNRMGTDRYAPNAPLTILIKGRDSPLLDKGELMKAVSWQQMGPQTVFVGIRAGTKVGNKDAGDIARILHDGATIPITPGMRAMFAMLARVGSGHMDASNLTGRAAEIAEALGPRIRDVHPLSPTASVLIIPPRPFISAVLENRTFRRDVKKRWEAALERALKIKGGGGGGGGAADLFAGMYD